MPLPGWGSRHCPPQGRWAPCTANSVPLVPWPSNNVPLNDRGYNLPRSCVARRAFVFSPHLEEIFFHLERKLYFPHTLSSLTWFRLWKTKMRQLLLLLFFFKLESECLPRPAWQACPLPASCHFSSPERLSSGSLTYSGSFPPRALAQNISFTSLTFIRQTSGLSWHFLLDLEIRSVSHIIWFYRSRYYSCRVFSTVVILYFGCHYWV